MQENKITGLREKLEQLTTEQLDEMLHGELAKENVDGAAVRLILDVLEEREKDHPTQVSAGVEEAWERYQAKTKEQAPHRRRIPGWLLRVASVVLVIGLLFAVVPRSAEAESLFERLMRWTDGIFEMFSSRAENDNAAEYVFQTDNPGLQEVYDTVVGLGVTQPVVPMWLPEGQELVECEVIKTPTMTSVHARFSDGNGEIVFNFDVVEPDASSKYHKDETLVDEYEIGGIIHNVMRNNDAWVAVWINSDMECSISIDCQEDILYSILGSIY